MINQVDRKLIFDFIQQCKACVISTVSPEGRPEAAAMAFSETEDLELIFQTPTTTRKYRNLKQNPNIAATIGLILSDVITVQYEGIVKEALRDEIDIYRRIHCAKNPVSAKYAYIAQNKYFKVTPKWIKYSNLKANPPHIITISF